MLKCECSSVEDNDFPVLSMQMGSSKSKRWFQYHPKYYLQKDKDKCRLLLKPEVNPYFAGIWLMGNAFLREYYSIHDYESKRIALIRVAETTRIMAELDEKNGLCSEEE